jgi:hypothetical protein
VSKICAAAVEPRDVVRDRAAFGVCHGDAEIFGALAGSNAEAAG